LLALSYAAAKYRFTRPLVGEDNIISITGGRHPLQELMVPTFVENDTCLVGGSDADSPNTRDAPSLMLLTGANYSGKSVYLKQVKHRRVSDTRSL